jgi:serine/threonine-protein kinase RsbW
VARPRRTRRALEDLVLATYEAIANAAEHAYADHTDTAGPIHLHARRTSDCVIITVTDEGEWRIPTGQGFRSRGMP